MEKKEALYQFLLRLADDNLISAQRMAEWCSNGPVLEEDLAMVNISLDMLGQAESFLEYAAELKSDGRDADDLAFGRSEREYFNHLLCEQPNGDFAVSMVKLFFFSAFQRELYFKLATCADDRLSAISAKALKESKYHYRHASDWVIRLGLGTAESKERMKFAVNEMYPFTDNFFEMDKVNTSLMAVHIAPDLLDIQAGWKNMIQSVLANASITLPSEVHMFKGGINGYHTEHLGHVLCEMQYLHHAHPGAKW
jgi:ring-1,2-phenylacetyl-CoA epoxidase subunit PaaC